MHRESLPHGTRVLSAAYDREDGTLEVGLAAGHVVEHFDVPLSAYHELIGSPDPDGYYAAHVRDHYRSAPIA